MQRRCTSCEGCSPQGPQASVYLPTIGKVTIMMLLRNLYVRMAIPRGKGTDRFVFVSLRLQQYGELTKA